MQLLLIFLKTYGCQRFGKVRNAEGWLPTMFWPQEKDCKSISLEMFIKNDPWRKASLKLPAFEDYGNQFFKMFHLISCPSWPLESLATKKKKRQSKVLLTRKGSRCQRNSMEASQKRVQNRNENLKAIEKNNLQER